nr:hypothetical protein CFP56_19364 [Quercus suber]
MEAVSLYGFAYMAATRLVTSAVESIGANQRWCANQKTDDGGTSHPSSMKFIHKHYMPPRTKHKAFIFEQSTIVDKELEPMNIQNTVAGNSAFNPSWATLEENVLHVQLRQKSRRTSRVALNHTKSMASSRVTLKCRKYVARSILPTIVERTLHP